MHTISEMGTSVPAFLGKLWRLVEDPETDDLICWSPNGRSFFIRNQAQFARELLPHYYKHNNMASFVRQLNMYGFHKKVSVELGGLKCDRDEMEFAHQYFCKDHPYLLDHIKRKIASNKTHDPSQAPIKPELMTKMLSEVRSMKGRQESFDSRLGEMKRENEALWRELALLRQKHHKQRQIVNKLIHFLLSLVQPNRGTGLAMKRRYPLMIDDANRQRIRQNKVSKIQHLQTGPAIHELDSSDPDLDSDYIVAEMLDSDQAPTIESPDHETEDNIREYYTDESIHLPQEVEICRNAHVLRKRSECKKKGEETLMLEVPMTKVQTQSSPVPTTPTTTTTSTQITKSVPSVATTSNSDGKTTLAKPIPVATVRSSKLAAMAANMKRNQQEVELDLDIEPYPEVSEEIKKNNKSKNDSLIKLENILIVPDMVTDDYCTDVEENSMNTMPSSVSSLSGNSNSNGSPAGTIGASSPETLTDMGNGTFGNTDFINNDGVSSPSASKTSALINQERIAAALAKQQSESSKNMSLSCVNPNSMPEANFRLESAEEVDTHLDTMQSELENLREILRGEGYSIDANTLLGVSNFERNLFGAEDPMSFGIPVNPDLDPHSNAEKEQYEDNNLNSGSNNKGELMMYNGAPNLLDFDDDIFLGPQSSSPAPAVTDASNNGFNPDPLELADNKGNIFDSLIANNTNSPQS